MITIAIAALLATTSLAAPADACSDDPELGLLHAIATTHAAWLDMDPAGVGQGLERIHSAFDCLEGPLPPDLAAELHLAAALEAEIFSDGDGPEERGQTTRALRAAMETMGQEALRRRLEGMLDQPEAYITEAALWSDRSAAVLAPEGYTVFVDGQATRERPLEHPCVLQVVDESRGGTLAWSGYLVTGEPPPDLIYSPPPPNPDPPDQREGLPTDALRATTWAGSGLLTAAGVTLGVVALTSLRSGQDKEDGCYETGGTGACGSEGSLTLAYGQDWRRARNLGAASAGLLTVGVSLGVGAVLTGR